MSLASEFVSIHQGGLVPALMRRSTTEPLWVQRTLIGI
jgi:hypothetical protein